jgi:hypothetical protein
LWKAAGDATDVAAGQRLSTAAGSLSGSLRMFLWREALLDDLRYDELVGGRDVTACED